MPATEPSTASTASAIGHPLRIALTRRAPPIPSVACVGAGAPQRAQRAAPRIVANRSLGSYDRPRLTTARTSSGTCFASAFRRRGGRRAPRAARRRSCTDRRARRRRRRTAARAPCSRACPSRTPRAASSGCAIGDCIALASTRASPKSATRARPSRSTSTLSGLKSRWTRPARVHGGEPRADLRRTSRRSRATSGARCSHAVSVVAVDELHRDEQPAAIAADLVHAHDVRMLEPRHRLRLAQQALRDTPAVVSAAHELDRDAAGRARRRRPRARRPCRPAPSSAHDFEVTDRRRRRRIARPRDASPPAYRASNRDSRYRPRALDRFVVAPASSALGERSRPSSFSPGTPLLVLGTREQRGCTAGCAASFASSNSTPCLSSSSVITATAIGPLPLASATSSLTSPALRERRLRRDRLLDRRPRPCSRSPGLPRWRYAIARMRRSGTRRHRSRCRPCRST